MENDYENIIFLYNFVYSEIDIIVNVGSVQKCTTRLEDYTDEVRTLAGVDSTVG